MSPRWLWLCALLPFLAAVAFSQLTPPVKPLPEVNPAEEAFIHTPAGFEEAGRPAVGAGEQAGTLQLRVLDAETGKPTFCRVNVVGADGNYYEPAEDKNILAPWSLHRLGNRQGKAPILYYGWFFYCTGEASVRVPAGPVRVEVWRGFETRPVTLSTQVARGDVRKIEIPLERTLRMTKLGYYSGDTHIHLNRKNEVDDERALDLMEAEDIGVGYVLATNETNAYTGTMDNQLWQQDRGFGPSSVRQRGPYTIASGQEYRCGTYGHILLMMHSRLVQKNRTINPNNWPVFGMIGQETRDLGGYSFHAHGGYSLEIYADYAQRATDGLELLQFAEYRGVGLTGWYRILNIGFRFPAVGSCDYPYCRALGDSRTYVQSATPPNALEWIRGAALGRSFFTTGPMLLLEVDGQPPGSCVQRAGAGPHALRGRVRARCDVTAITDLELIVNGEVVKKLQVPKATGAGCWLELDEPLTIGKSSWIAARTYAKGPTGKAEAEAHTNPVYVALDGKAPYNAADLDWLTARIDDQIAAANKRQFSEKPDVIQYFEQSKAQLLKIRAAGGQSVPESRSK